MADFSPCLETDSARRRYIVLDSWRGIAAICVALMHLQAFNRFDSHIGGWHFITNSFLFVDFFFVLSGFVITHSYHRSLTDLVSLRLFMIKRVARLWPLHFFTLTLFIALSGSKEFLAGYFGIPVEDTIISQGAGAFLVSFLFNLLLAQSVWPFSYNDFNGPSWSISVEFYTYLLFAGLSLHFRRWSTFAWMAAVLIGAIVSFYSASEISEPYRFAIFRCFIGFFLGCITYQIRNRPLRSTTLLEFLATAAIYLVVANADCDATHLLAPLVFSFAIFIFAQERGRISRLLATKALRVLGTLSYSIYMTHLFLILFFRYGRTFCGRMLHQTALEPNGILFVNQWMMDLLTLLALAIIVGFSFLTYRYIEVPWKSRIHRAMLPDSAIRSHG